MAERIGDVLRRAVEAMEQRLECWETLGELATEAANVGAKISVRENGFILFTGNKSELICFEDATVDAIRRGLERICA
jgi:hypothetical protein